MEGNVEKEMNENIAELLKTLSRRSKKDDLPGTVEAFLDEKCPICNRNLKKKKPCCGAAKGTKECLCGYRVILT
jgi:hypothetical protein